MKHPLSLLVTKTRKSFSKKIIVAVFAATLITATAFARGEEYKVKALNSLKKEFSTAQNVQWKVTTNYIKASFTWNNQQLEVFYDYNGETIAKSRHINVNSLPLEAQQYIGKKYADYTVTEAIEYNSEEINCYYVSVEKENTKQILQVSANGDVSIFQK